MEKEIEQDIKRTFPEVEFFRGEWVRKAMLDILLIYAREEPHIGYKQGMHELLAPILYVLKRVSLTAADAATINGAAAASGGKFASFAPLLDAEHVESDAYAAFRGLMTHTQDWFVSPARKRTTSSSLSLSSSTAGSASNAPLSMQDEAVYDKRSERREKFLTPLNDRLVCLAKFRRFEMSTHSIDIAAIKRSRTVGLSRFTQHSTSIM